MIFSSQLRSPVCVFTPDRCLVISGSAEKFNGRYELINNEFVHTEKGMVIRKGDYAGQVPSVTWDFCLATDGTVNPEPCKGDDNRQGVVSDDNGRPEAGEIRDWGAIGNSSITYFCGKCVHK